MYDTQYYSQLQVLMMSKNYQTMSDIFISYSQTLFELACAPQCGYTVPAVQHHRLISPAAQANQLKLLAEILSGNLKQAYCEVGKSLLQLIALVWAAIPIGMEDMLYSSGVPSGLYLFMAKTFVTESHMYFSNKNSPNSISQFILQKFVHIKESELYYQVLGPYYYLLAIQDQIKSNRRLSNITAIETQMTAKIQACTPALQSNINNSHLRFFFDKFINLRRKLQYTLKVAKPQGLVAPTSQMDVELLPLTSVKHEQESLEGVHINELYLKCVGSTEKLIFLLQYYRKDLTNLNSPALDDKRRRCRNAGREIQLMCLLLLQECKNDSLVDKLDIYVMLAAIKIRNKSAIDDVSQQIKMLFSFERIPSIEFTQILVCQMVVLEVSQSSNAVVKELMDSMLKAYQKVHASNHKEYIKLALLSTVYLNQQTSNIKSSNRKLQLEKLSEHMDVLNLINNINMLDYLIELIWTGKQINWGSIKLQGQQQSNPLDCIFQIDQAIGVFKDYLIKKLTIVQDGTDHEVDTDKLRCLLKKLLIKRVQLTNMQNYKQYFHNHALALLAGLLLSSSTVSYNQRCRLSLPDIVASLQQINMVSLYNSVPDTISRLLMLLLSVCLVSNIEYIKQALVCMQLWTASSDDKGTLDGSKVEQLISNNTDKFGNMSKVLFMTIYGYELVQILLDAYGHDKRYQEMAVKWATDTENYVYNWPSSRRDKLILDKRIRFINYIESRLPHP